MKQTLLGVVLFLALLSLHSCQESTELEQDIVPEKVISKLKALGFNPDGIEVVPEGYRIERDIIITESDLETMSFHDHDDHKGSHKQYSTNNLVSTNGSRVITVYMAVAGSGGRKGKKSSSGFNQNYSNALDLAISRYNSENLEISFARTSSSSGADISFTNLSKRDQRRGVLGSAGFPSGGDPYGTIRMNSEIDTRYGWSTQAIATVMAHEMGHCIGFRHTDYFDRSLSCGGSTSNEGDGGVGANHIPGTPTGFSAESWMLSCTGGGDRPFNNDDKVALDYLY